MPALTSLAAYKARFGILTSDDDTVISAIIPQVTVYAQHRCGRTFFSGSYSVLRDGLGQESFFLPAIPVASVTALYVPTPPPRVYDGTTLLTEGITFAVDSVTGRITRLDAPGFPAG